MELMIVVAIIGILASIAVFMFTRHTQKARASEVPAMLGEFKLRQQAFYLENDEYLSTGANDDDYFPSASPLPGRAQDFDLTLSPAPPDPQGTEYPGPSWQTLRMKPDKSTLYCVYVSIAGRGGDDTNVGPKAAGAPFSMGSTDLPVPINNWFYVMAECDFDGDGTPSRYFTLSDTEATIVQNRGE